MDYGKILRAIRIGRGMTAIDLAENVGIHPNTILLWERGKSQPSIYAYEKCLNACGFKIEIGKENTK